MAKIYFMRDDDGYGLLGLRGGINADVGNQVAGFVDGFQAFKCDILG